MIFLAKVGHTNSPGTRLSACSRAAWMKSLRGWRGGSDAGRGLGGQSPAQLQEQGGLFFFRFGNAAQREAAAVAGVELGIDHHDGAQVGEHLPGREARGARGGEFFPGTPTSRSPKMRP